MPVFESTVFGAPCWVDLTNGNLAASKPFYAAVFGWEFTDMGPDFGGYNIITKDGAAVGGAMQYIAEYMGPVEINMWTVYFATRDAATSLSAVTENGGTVMVPAMQVAGQGTSAAGIDPAGAGFGLWQPDQRKGYDRVGEHGFPAWFELQTRDFETVSGFYSVVLGASLGTDEMSEDMPYYTLDIDGEQTAGIWNIEGSLPDDAPTGWSIYFAVDDPDAAVAAVRAHGGTVLSEPEDTPYGRMANVLDPAGAALTIIANMPQ